jgi:hypothetical protein
MDRGRMRFPLRTVAAVLVGAVLAGAVVCDITVSPFRSWWNRQALTSSAVSSLLVVGVTALIFDEVVARRQRSERAVTVAVQGLIVYRQALRSYEAVTSRTSAAGDEMRILASMLLVASPPLFEDPISRVLLEEVQRMATVMYGTLSSGSTSQERLETACARMKHAVKPLAQRLPTTAQVAFDAPG